MYDHFCLPAFSEASTAQSIVKAALLTGAE